MTLYELELGIEIFSKHLRAEHSITGAEDGVFSVCTAADVPDLTPEEREELEAHGWQLDGTHGWHHPC